jgi:hypothetical protein
VLVTLLVLWVVVVPALIVAGTYVLSGPLGRRWVSRVDRLHDLAVEPVDKILRSPRAPRVRGEKHRALARR